MVNGAASATCVHASGHTNNLRPSASSCAVRRPREKAGIKQAPGAIGWRTVGLSPIEEEASPYLLARPPRGSKTPAETI